jgi:hypothetical protein
MLKEPLGCWGGNDTHSAWCRHITVMATCDESGRYIPSHSISCIQRWLKDSRQIVMLKDGRWIVMLKDAMQIVNERSMDFGGGLMIVS